MDSATSTDSLSPSPFKRKVEIPVELLAEIGRMRRKVGEFTAVAVGRCKLCPPKTKTAIELSHPLSKHAGDWCPTHGWLAFDSVKIRPVGEEHQPRKRNRK